MVPGLGPLGLKSLLSEVTDTEEIFSMSGGRLSKITGGNSNGIRTIRSTEEYKRELEYVEKENISVICAGDSRYPPDLNHIYDPPPVLYCRGKLTRDDINAVAIVGSRKCSMYGIQMAEKLAYELAEKGITVVSGMARGIDTAAHRGALKAGGRTIAVMGSGFRHIYPPGSEIFMRSIIATGAVITEYSSDITPSKGTFPRRNRIISGMSKGVIVVEAARRSGAMITVNYALEQGRDVFAVPGRVDAPAAKGTNFLIQNGAKLVMCVEDVLEELMLEVSIQDKEGAPTTQHPAPPVKNPERISNGTGGTQNSNDREQQVLDALNDKTSEHVDNIYERTEIDLNKLPEILLKLEMKGQIKALAGKQYVLAR